MIQSIVVIKVMNDPASLRVGGHNICIEYYNLSMITSVATLIKQHIIISGIINLNVHFIYTLFYSRAPKS